MAISHHEPKDMRKVGYVYTNDDHIVYRRQQLIFSSDDDEQEDVLEVSSLEERLIWSLLMPLLLPPFTFICLSSASLRFVSHFLPVRTLLNLSPTTSEVGGRNLWELWGKIAPP